MKANTNVRVKDKPRTIADFRAAHDPEVIVPNKFKAAFAAMEKIHPEHYLYEDEFRKLASLGQAQLSAYRDRFAAHIVETPGRSGKTPQRVYFATAKAATKVRAT